MVDTFEPDQLRSNTDNDIIHGIHSLNKTWFWIIINNIIIRFNFVLHRENILKTAKALVEDTKTLVAGAASNQEQLANAAQMAVKTITRLADVVKFGAGSLGSEQQEAQVCLLCCFWLAELCNSVSGWLLLI